jgi:hypothetical protein
MSQQASINSAANIDGASALNLNRFQRSIQQIFPPTNINADITNETGNRQLFVKRDLQNKQTEQNERRFNVDDDNDEIMDLQETHIFRPVFKIRQ